MSVAEHDITRKLLECVIVPDHDDREESPEVRYAKKKLREDGICECWVCGSKEKLQLHHYGAEWSLASTVDFVVLKRFLEEWDVYGYGKKLKDKPITSVDDIRNCMYLCSEHHCGINNTLGNGTGIHSMTFPVFLAQKLAKKGENPVPQEGEKIDDTMKRVG